ncbi:MAG: hypothetical protein PHT54_04770 [Candidatus Nanoarchaeia archaeon]|nr:hypothetical protein [Candidatus Nanoarchaeia archaeon]
MKNEIYGKFGARSFKPDKGDGKNEKLVILKILSGSFCGGIGLDIRRINLELRDYKGEKTFSLVIEGREAAEQFRNGISTEYSISNPVYFTGRVVMGFFVSGELQGIIPFPELNTSMWPSM